VFHVLYVLSICFVLSWVLRSNFQWPSEGLSAGYLVLSLCFCFSGFIAMGVEWGATTRCVFKDCPWRVGIQTNGAAIFSKYIPGKVWTILGRASALENQGFGNPLQNNYLSIVSTVVSLYAGTIISLPCLTLVNVPRFFLISGFCLVLGVPFLFNSKFLQTISLQKYGQEIRLLELYSFFKILPFHLLTWICWGVGFLFLLFSFGKAPSSILLVGLFPLSAICGILAIFAPGGLGVRESLLTLGLLEIGFAKGFAMQISSLSRLWFFLGELFLFLMSMVLVLRRSRKIKKN